MTQPGSRFRVRIVGTDLPGGSCGAYSDVLVGIQIGQDVVQVARADAARACWEVEVTGTNLATSKPSVKGPAVRGRGDERFLYLAWLAAGAGGHKMFRRAKLQFDGVETGILKRAARAGILLGTLSLTDSKGMPVCASVRPPVIVWSVGDG